MKDMYKEGKLEKLLEKYNIKSLEQLEGLLNQRYEKVRGFNILKEAYNQGLFSLDVIKYGDNEKYYVIYDTQYDPIIEIARCEYKLLKELLEDDKF